jgi:uncharacterized protein with PIN domain
MTLVADSSAILAVLFNEPDREHFREKLKRADRILICALNWWEVQVKLNSVVGLESEELFDRPEGSCRRLSLQR